MARILSLEECPLTLRNTLLRMLRVEDEATLLPQAAASPESSIVKNCVFRLQSKTPSPPSDIFSTRWYDGITAVLLDDRDVAPLLKDASKKAAVLARLAAEINSEVCDSSVSVGQTSTRTSWIATRKNGLQGLTRPLRAWACFVRNT